MLPDPSWRERAACRTTDTAVFFPDYTSLEEPEYQKAAYSAKVICGVCKVRSECLEYALANHERYGIWGGLGPAERKRERRRRKEALV